MKLVKKAKRGFTLVELVVVIAVIAILAAVSVGAYFGVTESANNSRLEQETKQLHTAIQTISLGTKPTQSMSKNGLIISNEIAFDGDLDEALGTDYDVFVGETPNTVAKPTVVFKTTTFTKKEVGQPTVYKTFEYYNPEISGKYVEADVVTGDFNILNNNDVTVDTTADMETLYFIDHPVIGDTNSVNIYMFKDGNNNTWPGEAMNKVASFDTFEEGKKINIYSFTVNVNEFDNFVFNWNDGNNQTIDCIYDKESKNNAFVMTGLKDNEGKLFTIRNTEYIVNEWNYGRFSEPGGEIELTSYYFVDNNAFTGSDEKYYVHIFNSEDKTVKEKFPGERISVHSTITSGSNGVFNIFKIDVNRNLFNSIVVSKVNENELSENNNGVTVQTVDLSLTELDNNECNLYAATNRFTSGMSYFCVPGLFESGKWDYGQFETESNNKTYYFLDQKTFSDAGSLYVYPFSSSTGEVKQLFPGYQYNASLQEEVAITSIGSTHGIVNIYSITINRALYDTVIFSSVKSNETKMQTINIDLTLADSNENNLFALSAKTNEKGYYDVVFATKDQNNIEYGQKWFDEASYKLVSFLKPEHWNWATVKIHYWGGVTTSTWPGELMEENDGVYSYYVPEDTTHVQFNDGTNANKVEKELVEGYGIYNAYVSDWMNENNEFSTEPNVRILGNFLNQDKWADNAWSGENVLTKEDNIYSSGELTLYSGDSLKVVFNSTYIGYSNLIDETENFTNDSNDNFVLKEEKDGVYTFTFNVLNGEITYTLVNSIEPHSHVYDDETHKCVCGEVDPDYVPETPAEPSANVFFKPSNKWFEANARFAAYAWNASGNSWFDLTDSDYDLIYEVNIPKEYTNIKFVRFSPTNKENSFDKKRNEINTDLKVPTDNNNCYIMNNDSLGAGKWGEKTPSIFGLVGSVIGWGNDQEMSKISNGIYTFSHNAQADEQVKIRLDKSWKLSWGFANIVEGKDFCTSTSDGNFVFKSAGNYLITFNVESLSISITLNSNS